jgi:hypothetical protein
MMKNVMLLINFIVWKRIDNMPYMRNMVQYMIVAHKTDEEGKFYWNKKVLLK